MLRFFPGPVLPALPRDRASVQSGPPEQKRQAEVKKAYGHDLIKSYENLPVDIKKKLSLSSKQLSLLEQANKIYSGKGFEELPLLKLANKHRGKGFEYVDVGDALRGFSNFPDLKDLDELAKAIMTAA